MSWSPKIRLFGSTKDTNELDTSSKQAYWVYSNENDVVVGPNEIYDAFEPDNRYPRSQFFEEYKAQVFDWNSQNLASLEQARQQVSAQMSRWRKSDTLISVLIDHSGSLRGEKQMIAHIIANELDRSLLASGAAFEMLGFTTRSWRGGKSRKTWKRRGSPLAPGRLCDLMHIKYRAWDDRGETGNRFEPLLDPQVLKENVDGEAIDWAQSRFESSPYTKHVILLISDGAPVDDSTLMENHSFILIDQLRSKIEDYERGEDGGIIGFGIGFEVNSFYSTSCEIVSLDEIPAALERIISLISETLDNFT